MPAPQEWCEVRTANGVFRNWTAVTVRYSVDPSFERFVQLELAEVMPPGSSGSPSLLNPGNAGALVAQRLKPGDRIDVALGGQLVIEGGYVKIRQTAYDANRHAVQVVAVSKANPIREVSVDIKGQQFRNYSLSAIANAILAPVGVGFSLVNPPPGADLPFRNVIVHHGETIGEMIERLARQRGCWLWSDTDGTILAGNPATDDGCLLAEGVNIVAANSYIEFPWAEMVVSQSQSFGSDDLWGRNAAEISAQATIPGGDAGKKVIVLAEHPNTQQELQTRTDHEANAILAAIHRDLITHKGWFKPGSGSLWQIGESVPVKSPMLYPFMNGQMNMRVWGVTCAQNNTGATTTQVELVNDATFSQKFPNAQDGNPFNPSATPSQPQAAT